MTHSAAGWTRVLVCTGAFLLTGAVLQPLAAQQQPGPGLLVARLQGVVAVEETLQPVSGATIEVVDTDVATRSGQWGQFELPDAPLGTVWVRVTAPGYPSLRQEVELRDDGVAFVQFLLRPVSTVLSEILVQVGIPAPEGAVAHARTAWDMLALKVPSISGWSSGNVGKNDQVVRLRGVSSITQSTEPILVVDDVLVARTAIMDVLSQIPAEDIESIEVLRGASASIRFPFAADGVISVRTKH